jgi:hypothetical protein
MDEDKVFGPLTLRQFLYSVFSFGVMYLSYTYLPLKISIPIIILAVIFFISGFIVYPTVIINEDYLKLKRSQCDNLEQFQRWLKKKIAEIQSQINMRATRGLIEDPKLNQALQMFENALRDMR